MEESGGNFSPPPKRKQKSRGPNPPRVTSKRLKTSDMTPGDVTVKMKITPGDHKRFLCAHQAAGADRALLNDSATTTAWSHAAQVVGAASLQHLPCAFLWHCAAMGLTPKALLQEIWGASPDLEHYSPASVIGRVDGGDLVTYLQRLVVECFPARWCDTCYEQRVPNAGKKILKILAPNGVSQALMIGQVAQQAQAMVDQLHMAADPNGSMANAKRRLIEVKANLVELTSVGMSAEVVVSMQFKRHPLMQDNATVASKEWLEAEIMPYLPLVVQDNFLKSTKELSEEAPFQDATWRHEPVVGEAANGTHVVLRCALCRGKFVAQASTNIANVTKHLVGQHWPAVKRRIGEIKHAMNFGEPLPALLVQSEIEVASAPAPSADSLLEGILNLD